MKSNDVHVLFLILSAKRGLGAEMLTHSKTISSVLRRWVRQKSKILLVLNFKLNTQDFQFQS